MQDQIHEVLQIRIEQSTEELSQKVCKNEEPTAHVAQAVFIDLTLSGRDF